MFNVIVMGEEHFYNCYIISKDEIHTIGTDFIDSGSYGSRFQSRCLGHTTYKYPGRGKRDSITHIQ